MHLYDALKMAHLHHAISNCIIMIASMCSYSFQLWGGLIMQFDWRAVQMIAAAVIIMWSRLGSCCTAHGIVTRNISYNWSGSAPRLFVLAVNLHHALRRDPACNWLSCITALQASNVSKLMGACEPWLAWWLQLTV